VFGELGPYPLDYPFFNFSDTLTPGNGAELAFDGDQGAAAVTRAAGGYRTAFLAFPLRLPASSTAETSAFLEASTRSLPTVSVGTPRRGRRWCLDVGTEHEDRGWG
jgi:hypothetical protein